MAQYEAVFFKVDGLSENIVEPSHKLKAETHDKAADEALTLPRPKEANFIKLFREGQFEGPAIGLDL